MLFSSCHIAFHCAAAAGGERADDNKNAPFIMHREWNLWERMKLKFFSCASHEHFSPYAGCRTFIKYRVSDDSDTKWNINYSQVIYWLCSAVPLNNPSLFRRVVFDAISKYFPMMSSLVCAISHWATIIIATPRVWLFYCTTQKIPLHNEINDLHFLLMNDYALAIVCTEMFADFFIDFFQDKKIIEKSRTF